VTWPFGYALKQQVRAGGRALALPSPAEFGNCWPQHQVLDLPFREQRSQLFLSSAVSGTQAASPQQRETRAEERVLASVS